MTNNLSSSRHRAIAHDKTKSKVHILVSGIRPLGGISKQMGPIHENL